jgi:hypothetical protein
MGNELRGSPGRARGSEETPGLAVRVAGGPEEWLSQRRFLA